MTVLQQQRAVDETRILSILSEHESKALFRFITCGSVDVREMSVAKLDILVRVLRQPHNHIETSWNFLERQPRYVTSVSCFSSKSFKNHLRWYRTSLTCDRCSRGLAASRLADNWVSFAGANL